MDGFLEPRPAKPNSADVASKVWTGEAIISDTLGRGPEVEFRSEDGRWRFCRWRQFVGSYALPALPDPMFVVQLAGKTDVRVWEASGWSEATSFPGAASIVPKGQQTRWLVDGELDVVTMSMDGDALRAQGLEDQFESMQFAYSDPFGAALAGQILTELYTPALSERDAYVATLIDALKAHMLRRSPQSRTTMFPTSEFSSHRIHRVANAILQCPEREHSLEELAELAGVSQSHLCRVFKRAMGMSPHQYVLKARLERARHLLSHSPAPMSQVAELVGFQSQSQFTRAFRRYAGKTPSAFRRLSTNCG